jgi:hypothetical protein
MIFLLALVLRLLVPASAAREMEEFRLYKFQQPIGIERDIRATRADGSSEIRSNFSFTDRTTTVPLAATLVLGRDGSVLRYEAWGSTSRFSRIDDRISVEGGTVTIEREGKATKTQAPKIFFAADGYAPVVVTEQLWRYWNARGRPAELPLVPSGSVSFQSRGPEEITNDEGQTVRLERFALTGLEWGRETVWFDSAGRLAAVKAVDAEFDHFEATRSGYSEALPALVRSAAADGMAELRELSRPMLAVPDEPGPVAFIGGTLIDATGAPPVRDAVVVVDKGRIVEAGPRSSAKIPAGSRQIEVAGKTILPGLWDMHAHFEQVEWGPVYLAAGVTTVRDCGNELDFIRSVRDTIDAGKGLGPSILLACIVDGDGPAAIGTTRLRDESEIPKLIQTDRDARCSQVKIYSSLPPKLIAPLARAAHQAGLSVTGHVPSGIGAVHAVEAGMDQINHLAYVVRAFLPPSYNPDANLSRPVLFKAIREIDLASPSSRATLEFFRDRKVVVDPTLALYELQFHTAGSCPGGARDRKGRRAGEEAIRERRSPAGSGRDRACDLGKGPRGASRPSPRRCPDRGRHRPGRAGSQSAPGDGNLRFGGFHSDRGDRSGDERARARHETGKGRRHGRAWQARRSDRGGRRSSRRYSEPPTGRDRGAGRADLRHRKALAHGRVRALEARFLLDAPPKPRWSSARSKRSRRRW